MKYLSAVIGLLLTAASSFLLWRVMQSAVPDRHLVYLFAGGVGFGMLLVIPTIIFSTAKTLLTMIGPYLPQVMIGGRRSTDPPAAVPVAPASVAAAIEVKAVERAATPVHPLAEPATHIDERDPEDRS